MPVADFGEIYRVIAQIPPGSVTSYGRIARLAGLPRRARLVGTALKRAPRKLQLPWHRVVRATGQLAFPEGSEAFHEQCRRLSAEGVAVEGDRVDLDRYGWERPLDAMLWGPGPDNGRV